ncbi:hypothetical protein SUGI_0126390 [Cryptomeria japonica]|nr:hypothetical protein SUGI_0126390 [Cryptomeria japonica]
MLQWPFETEELQKELSCVTGEDVETFTPKQLGYLEENLVLAAKKVRERKIEVLKYERGKTESKVPLTQAFNFLLKITVIY